MFIERKEYPLGNNRTAISYEIHDDNGHTVQLTPLQMEELAQQLEERKSQIFHDVNGIVEPPFYDEKERPF